MTLEELDTAHDRAVFLFEAHLTVGTVLVDAALNALRFIAKRRAVARAFAHSVAEDAAPRRAPSIGATIRQPKV